MKITVDPFDKTSIDRAIKTLNRYKRTFAYKEKMLRQRLASIGATLVSLEFSRAIYSGTNDVTVRVDDDGTKATVYAEGEAVMFIEFGTGDKYGHGHPMNEEFGYGPGTYSDGPNGKHHWNDPKGWYFGHGQHTFGNPPNMAMIHARDEMVARVTEIAREVFR